MNRSSVTATTLLFAAALAYSRVFTLGFVFDDRLFILNNTRVLSGLSLEGIAWAFTATYHANWQPLTWISCMLDVSLFGPGPAGFHAVNLALHLANVAILFTLLSRLTGALWRPALVAALFALHPLNVEAVAWVSERSALLGTLFALLAIAAYRRHAAAPRPARLAVAAALFALSLLAKPLWVTLPLLLLLLDFWPLGRFAAGAPAPLSIVAEKLPLLALSGAASVATLIAQWQWGAVVGLDLVSLSTRISNALLSYVRYLGMALWPGGLAAYYPLRVESSLPATLAAVALLAAICVAAAAGWRRRPWFPVGWAWYLGSLVPMIGIVQVGGQSLADRYAYVPLLGLFTALAWGLGEATGNSAAVRRAVVAACVAALCALGAATWVQTGYWQDDVTLFSRAARVTRDNAFAHFNLGAGLLERGDQRGAREHLREAVRISPDYAEARVNLGIVLVNDGAIEAGIEQYRQALRLKPAAATKVNLGEALVRLGRRDEAEREYRAALLLAPAAPIAHMNLANLLSESRRFEAAYAHYREARRLAPGDARIPFNLGVTLAADRRFAEAATAYREALLLQPDHAQARQGLRALPAAFR